MSKLKVTILEYRAVASWTWGEGMEDDVCGICQMPYEGCPPGVQFPGDGAPVVWGKCGHAFHLQCISQWLTTKNTCPICRRDVHYVDAPRGTTPTAHDHRAVFARHAVPGSLAGAAEPELRFRLDRIRARYPRYVTTRHVDAWTRRRFSGPLANDPDCPLVVPPSTAASSGSHRHRSSSSSGGGRGGGSFSGGSSAGGAGRGF
mmetsp:Transcript_27106/g.108555  ORF Transcript_27106/g.108555 Transcript_27106/m.108555 type:complete len:203 (+) Transcript_27106:87-695(+)